MGTLTRATKNLARRKVRAAIVIAALSLALTMLIILPPSIEASQATAQRSIDILTNHANLVSSTINLAATEIDCTLGMNTTFSPNMGNDTVFEYKTVNITDYDGLSTIPDVAAVIPILKQLSPIEYGYLVGVPLDSASLLSSYPSLLPANITEGRNLQAGDSGVVVVQERLAKIYGVTIGSTLTLLGQNFEVVGIEGQEALNSTAVTMSLAEAQALTGLEGQASGFKIYVNSIDNVNAVVSRIANEYPDLQVTEGLSQLNSAQEIQASINKQLEAAQTNLNQIQNTGLTEIAIAVVADTAIILFIMLYSVRERTREIGTLKAIGASNRTILAQFILEGTLLSLIAGAVGIAIGTVGASTIGNLLLPRLQYNFGQIVTVPLAITITPELVLAGLGIAVALGALGSLYPAWRATKIRPAEAMRHE